MQVTDRANSNLAEDWLFEYTDGEHLEDSPEFLEAVKKITNLIERPEVYPVYNDGNAIPQVGEYVLVNEKECQSFTREHGGRYRNDYKFSRRYFGEVMAIHPHVIVLKTHRGMVSERILDFKVGILRYAKLKKVPDRPEEISYDERLLKTFIKSFESLLEE